MRGWAATLAGGRLVRGMQRLNARHPWSHNDHFHPWIVANLPERCERVLDVGCGRGKLLAALSPSVTHVVGNDRDAGMREQARRRCAGLENVSVVDGVWSEIAGPFDAVTMIAVLHHLELDDALRQVTALLAPGGRFLAVGLARPESVRDHLWDALCVLTNPVIGYVKHPWPSRTPPGPPPFPVRDPEFTLAELREALQRVMPGTTLRRRLGFRHTITWTKPTSSAVA